MYRAAQEPQVCDPLTGRVPASYHEPRIQVQSAGAELYLAVAFPADTSSVDEDHVIGRVMLGSSLPENERRVRDYLFVLP